MRSTRLSGCREPSRRASTRRSGTSRPSSGPRAAGTSRSKRGVSCRRSRRTIPTGEAFRDGVPRAARPGQRQRSSDSYRRRVLSEVRPRGRPAPTMSWSLSCSGRRDALSHQTFATGDARCCSTRASTTRSREGSRRTAAWTCTTCSSWSIAAVRRNWPLGSWHRCDGPPSSRLRRWPGRFPTKLEAT